MSTKTINIAMRLSDKFNAAFPDGFIPEGNIDKTKCRIGITWQAFHEKRHTWIVVPTTAIIEDAQLNYPELNLFAAMDEVTPQMVAKYLKSGVKHLKIISTPDSFWKVISAAISIGKLDWLYKEVFLYLDEYHCYATEAFREKILNPFDEDRVWRFKKKAFGSATPYPLSDPRFRALQRYKLTYEEKFGRICIINNPNPELVLNYMLTYPNRFFPGKVFVFYNSVTKCGEAILRAGITDANIYCRNDEKNLINLKEAKVYFKDQPKDGDYKKFNFFSKRYDEGWALRDDTNATIILVTDVKHPHTMVGIPYQGFQAVSRLEQAPQKIYHITNDYGKESMRTFEAIEKNWLYNSAKHVIYYNQHRLACKKDDIEHDGGMQDFIRPYSRFNKLQEAEVFHPKLDQVICAEWIKEHYSNKDTINKAWLDLNYETEQISVFLQPISRQRKTKEDVNRQVIERWEYLNAHPELYVYNENDETSLKIEFQLLYEAYQILGVTEIDKLSYNDKAMKEALIETSNNNSEAKLRLILMEEYKLNSRHTKKSMKVRLQELYDQLGFKKLDGSRKIATAEQFNEFGLFQLKDCRIDEQGEKKNGFEVIKTFYTLKVAA